jgi:hypothetical protein
MKKYFFLFISLVSLSVSFSQTDTLTSCEYYHRNDALDTIYSQSTIMPKYPGGDNAYYEFVANNFIVPAKVEEFTILYVEIIIESDGSISDHGLLLSQKNNFTKSVDELIKIMPSWLPGECQGRKVRCDYIIPIRVEN